MKMIVKNLKIKTLALTLAVTILFPISMVQATTQNIDATANFLAAITLSGSAMDFSDVVYSATPSGIGDTVTLGTNGSATYAGVFSAGSGASTAAGDVTITAGTNGTTIEARCDGSATLTNGSGSSIQISTLYLDAENDTHAPGAGGGFCAGVGGGAADTLVLNLGTLDSFKLGGIIAGFTASSFAGGAHSTANAGGNDIQVDVTYQ